MKRILIIVTLFALQLTSTAVARTWKDATGKFAIEATLVELKDGVVRLKKTDGSVISVPFNRLSAADQAFLRGAPPSSSMAGKAKEILRKNCHSCHGGDGTDEGGLNFILNLERLVSSGKVVSNAPDRSPLLKRILSGDMPPDGESPRPSADEIEILKKWVQDGAKSDHVAVKRKFISNDDFRDLIHSDLSAINERDQKFTRYFTLTHLWNAGLSDDELQTYRLALSKLINSLSWERKLVHPTAIDPARSIFRVDIRDLRWSVATWDAILASYPYGVRLAQESSTNVYFLAKSPMPYVRADWFVATASAPPLYHDILGLPKTLVDLQELLKINIAQNVRQDRAVRAGFTESGVSEYPRIIERHHTSDGAFWLSHDFMGSSEKRNFFTNPIDFEADGGEVIFSLPNGLQAYYLVDAKGNRIDKAPTSVVKDPMQLDGTVVNGVSCMRCHAGGVIPKGDEVRRNVLANSQAFQKQIDNIKALYIEQDEMAKLMEQDRLQFVKAASELGIKRLSPTSEPIYNMSRRFHEALDLRLASAEFGLTPTELQEVIEKSVSLQRKMGTLRIAGGTIKRDAFEGSFGALVRPLGVGSFVPPKSGDATASTTPTKKVLGKMYQIGGRSRWPTFLGPTPVPPGKDGLDKLDKKYVRTRDGRYLTKNFVFEVLVHLPTKNGAIVVGMGEGRGGGSYNEPVNSVHLKIRTPGGLKGAVGLKKNEVFGGENVGNIKEEGTHRVTITKEGDAVTFSIDVDNDGPTDDDMELTVPNIKEYADFLHSKNTYLFFGGDGGTFKGVRLTEIR